MKSILLGLTCCLLLVGVIDGKCLDGYEEIHSNCYRFYRETSDVLTGILKCSQAGGHLTSVNSGEEMWAIASKLNKDKDQDYYWTSGFSDGDPQEPSSWYWLRTGLHLTFTEWCATYPSDKSTHRCLAIKSEGSNCWVNLPCDQKVNEGNNMHFICKSDTLY